jgi:anti-sigma B factor antagonist
VHSDFAVEVRTEDRATVLAVRGELDLASSTALEQALEQAQTAQPELVVLDLTELEFMDSTGLSVLVKANQRAHDAGKRFALVKGSPQVQRLLTLTGVTDRITVAETPEELLGGG